jgi:hypothetical protein
MIKIFDRRNISDRIDNELICINSLGQNECSSWSNIMNDFIEKNYFFKLIIDKACELLNIKKCKMLVFYNNTWINIKRGIKSTGWHVHPILIKSILRHMDNVIAKSSAASIIYGRDREIDYDTVMNCSLLDIVDSIKYNEYNLYFSPNRILNKSDMFNDDQLIAECLKHLLQQTLFLIIPKCLLNIICEYINSV